MLCSSAFRLALAMSFTWMKSLVWLPSSKMWGGLLFSMRLVNMAAHPVYGFDRACLEPLRLKCLMIGVDLVWEFGCF